MTESTETTDFGKQGSHAGFNYGITILFGMLIIYMAFDAFKKKHSIAFGHEASLVTLIGLGVSYCFIELGQSEFNHLVKFNDDLFFYVILPPIVFANGFNLHRKKFFSNFTNILIFGVIGTFIAFGSFVGLTYCYQKYVATDGFLAYNGF